MLRRRFTTVGFPRANSTSRNSGPTGCPVSIVRTPLTKIPSFISKSFTIARIVCSKVLALYTSRELMRSAKRGSHSFNSGWFWIFFFSACESIKKSSEKKAWPSDTKSVVKLNRARCVVFYWTRRRKVGNFTGLEWWKGGDIHRDRMGLKFNKLEDWWSSHGWECCEMRSGVVLRAQRMVNFTGLRYTEFHMTALLMKINELESLVSSLG